MELTERQKELLRADKKEEIARAYPEAWETAKKLGIPVVYDFLFQEGAACAFLRGIKDAEDGVSHTDETLCDIDEVQAYVTGWRVYLRRTKSDRKQFTVEY